MDPCKFLLKERETYLRENNELKRELLNSLKLNKIKDYQSDDLLRVYIPKTNGKLRPLGIPTLKDRTLQKLLKLIMEPYKEPLGDKNSYGFRPGRNANQATSMLHNSLHYRQNSPDITSKRRLPSLQLVYKGYLRDKYSMETINNDIMLELNAKEGELQTFKFRDAFNKPHRITVSKAFLEKSNKISFYKSQYILDADIKGCFDNISHNWLIVNTPMPIYFEYLLPIILKPRIVERKPLAFSSSLFNKYIAKFFKNINTHENVVLIDTGLLNSGVPQGGIISPLLKNWTLDGLEETAKIGADIKSPDGTRQFDNEAFEFLKRKEKEKEELNLPTLTNSLINKKTIINGYRSTW